MNETKNAHARAMTARLLAYAGKERRAALHGLYPFDIRREDVVRDARWYVTNAPKWHADFVAIP